MNTQKQSITSPERTEYKKQRLIEDAETEFAIAQLPVKVADASPIARTITVVCNYVDFLMAKQGAKRNGWTLQRVEFPA